MKPILACLFLLCFLMQGCETKLFNPTTGKKLATFGGRYQSMKYSGAGVFFEAIGMSHATETRAAGSVVGTAGTVALPIVRAVVTGGGL